MRWLQLVKNSLSFGFWCMYMYYMYICTVNPKWETWKLWILVPNVIIFGWYNRIPYEGLSVVLYYLIKLQLVIIMINYNHHEAWWDIHELTGAPPCTFFPNGMGFCITHWKGKQKHSSNLAQTIYIYDTCERSVRSILLNATRADLRGLLVWIPRLSCDEFAEILEALDFSRTWGTAGGWFEDI